MNEGEFLGIVGPNSGSSGEGTRSAHAEAPSVIRFLLSFAEPENLQTGLINYRIFDPTYYVEMLQAEAGEAIVVINAP